MAKLVLTNLASLANQTAAISNINANNTLIETALENTLSRDGTSPNTMSSSLDMNSNSIINLPEPVTAAEAATKSYVDAFVASQLPSTSLTVTPFMLTVLDDVAAVNARTTLGAAASGANTDLTSVYLNNTGLKIKDTDASHGLTIKPGSNITADRILTLTTGDAARTLDISAGDVTISTAGAALIDDASATAQRTTLGLGTIATQAASAVAITGGTVTGITDLAVADGGTGASTQTDACKNLGTWRVLAKSGVQTVRSSVNAAGDATEAALATVTIPANTIGPNGALRVTVAWSYTNSASTKSMKIRLNGIAGTLYENSTATTTTSMLMRTEIFNRNSASSQVGNHLAQTVFTGTTTAYITSAIDTTANVDLVFSANWGAAASAEAIRIESYIVEVCQGS